MLRLGFAGLLAFILPAAKSLNAAACAFATGSPCAIYASTCARIAMFSAVLRLSFAFFAIRPPLYIQYNLTGVYMPKYSVPKQIRSIAQAAVVQNLKLPISKRAAYKDSNDGRRIEGTGMRTARRLIAGAIDEQQLQLMRAWFARHGASEREAEARKSSNSKASIAWALWGGNAGRKWAAGMLREIERE